MRQLFSGKAHAPPEAGHDNQDNQDNIVASEVEPSLSTRWFEASPR
jgi:hypothetical protein